MRTFGPFVLPVRDIVRQPGEMREFVLEPLAAEQWGAGLVSVRANSEVDIDVRLESVHEGILASGTATAVSTGECGRCLTPIAEPVEVEFQELFAYDRADESDFEVHGDHVDLEPVVRDAIVLALPFQPVCGPDCRGLDPVTGEKITADRSPEPSVPTDPRWSALREFHVEHDRR